MLTVIETNLNTNPITLPYTSSTLQISVEEISPLNKPEFISHKHQQILKKARTSFSIHGKVPLIDIYDHKAAIFLINISYNLKYHGQTIPTKEALSLRFIPYRGNPIGDENTELYLPDSIKTEEFNDLNQLLINPNVQFEKKIETLATNRLYTISRICAIRPQPLININAKTFNAALKTIRPNNRNKYTSLAYVIGCAAFIKSLKAIGITNSIFATQLHDSLYDQIDCFRKTHPLNLIPAAEFLNTTKENIRINRSRYNYYPYLYSSYFLNQQQYLQAIIYLINRGIISSPKINELLSLQLSSPDIIDNPKPKHLRDLGPILASKSKSLEYGIPWEKVIKFLDQQVQDGPTLRFAHQEVLDPSINGILALTLPKITHHIYNQDHAYKRN
jgi:hypothetical protein